MHSVFSHKNNSTLYWKALTHIARGNKDAALKVVEGLHDEIPAAHPERPQDIEDLFDQLFLRTVAYDPQLLSQLGLFESIGIHEHNAELTDVSVEALVQILEETKQSLRDLNTYDPASLMEDQQLSYSIFLWMLDHAVAGEKFLFHTYKITQLEGVLTQLSALLTQFHKLENEQDARHYISRLSKVSQQFKQALDFLIVQENKGIVPPRFTIEKVLTSIKKSAPTQIEASIFYAHFEQQIRKLNLPNAAALLQQARLAMENHVYPAYKALQDHFTQLLTRVSTNIGVWALPNGDEYYTYMLRCHTTTHLSANEIHELGLHEVATVHQEMRRIFAANGTDRSDKTVGTLMQELNQDPQFYYPNTGAGRQECLADYNAILERSRKQLAHLFDLKPRAGVSIQQVPAHEEEGAPPAYYYAPSIDGSRPGVFFANLRNMDEVPRYSMETLTIHEAEPGHHFQLALQGDMNIPMLRKLGTYTAYIEGWALYTEKLAYEQGFYSSPYAQLGHLRDELLRAARLVIDTGIHHKRWTREQAIAYMEEATGFHHDTVVSEVERYFVLPGQACAYKIGQLKILELRKRAQEKLQGTFDIKKFHNTILQTAAVPLTILEEVVDHYIKVENQG